MVLRHVRRLVVSLIEGTALVVLVIAACYVSIGRILIANIESFHSDIDRRLSVALNVPVRSSKLSGDWVYLDPVVSIQQVVVGAVDKPAVSLGKVSARIDTVASIISRRLVLRDISVNGMSLGIAESGDGHWGVVGLPRSGKPFNPDPLLDAMGHIGLAELSQVDINVVSRRGEFEITDKPGIPLQLREEGDQKTLSMPLMISRKGSRDVREFDLLGRYRGDPRNLPGFSANLYLRVPQLDISGFLGPVAGLPVREAVLRGSFWLDCDHGRFELRGLPRIEKFSVEKDDGTVNLLDGFAATVAAASPAPGQWHVNVTNMDARLGNVSWKVPNVDLVFHHKDDDWSWGAQLASFEVGDALRLANDLGRRAGLVSADKLKTIDKMAPGGTLRDILIRKDGPNAEIRLTSRIMNGHINPYKGSPGIDHIDGFASLSPGEGYIDLDMGSFTLDFAAAFPDAWPLDRARGRVSYVRSPGYLHIQSGLLQLARGELTAAGKFLVNMPQDTEKRTWGLEIGLRNADLLDVHRYLPRTLSDNLVEWLDRSIKGGGVSESGLLFHGPFGRFAPQEGKLYELYFNVNDATLAYDPAWPPVTKLHSNLYIGNDGVFSDDATGMVYGSQVSDGHVHVPIEEGVGADAVLIDANVAGPLSDGIRVLNETPLADATNNMAKAWTGRGDMRGNIKLDIPMGQRAGQPTGVDVHFSLADSGIQMGDLNLDAADLTGKFRYTSDAGLSSKAFSARLLGRQARGRIETHRKGDSGAIDVAFDGKVDMARLYEWSGQSLLSRADGIMDYSALLHIPFGGQADGPGYVQATSNLEGVSLHLPPPMKKAADDAMALRYRQSFLASGYRIDIDLGDETHASLKTSDGIVQGGQLHFGSSPMGKVKYDKVKVTGSLAFVDYNEWKSLTSDLDKRTNVSLQSAVASTLDAIDVKVAKMDVLGTQLENVDTHIERGKGTWNVQLTNRMLKGVIKVPDDVAKPYGVALDYLHFTSAPHSDDAPQPDPLADVAPRELDAIDFSTKSLTLDGEDYGAWSFRFRPSTTGGRIESLQAEVKGLSILDDSVVTWDDTGEAQSSHFVGRINVPSLASALKQWGYASSIETENMKLNADVRWPGSPANVDIYDVEGQVSLYGGKGRFVQAEGGAGALKLLGIFDFASLARRFRFDFSDIVDKGFSFTEIKGSTRLDKGTLSVVDPILIVGSGSTFKIGGSVNLKTGKLDNDMIVTLPVTRNLPWYAAYSAIATGPLAGVGVWLAQKVFENQIDQMSSAKYKITGTLDQPVIEFVSIFSDKVRESAAPDVENPTDGTAAPDVSGQQTTAPDDAGSPQAREANPGDAAASIAAPMTAPQVSFRAGRRHDGEAGGSTQADSGDRKP